MAVAKRNPLCLIAAVGGFIFLILQLQQFLAISVTDHKIFLRIANHKLQGAPVVNGDFSVTSIPKSRKVAILIPYTGSSLPSWFRTFMFTAQLSSDIFDWYIFVTEEKISIATPSNVFIVYVPESELFSRIVQMDPKATMDGNTSLAFWRDKLAETVKIFSYLLVEFKPCLGFIFKDYVAEYSHWGYGDVDILVGRASSFITKETIDLYDIYTSSFGDTNRMYMRGQLTIIRNSDKVNSLWRNCRHFPTLTTRIDEFLKTYMHHTTSRNKGWKLQSAEGCISRVYADTPNVSILVDPTQISDAFHAPNSERESFMLGSALLRCYEGPVDIEEVAKTKFLGKNPRRYPYADIPAVRVLQSPQPKCEYWIESAYQVCLDETVITRDAYIDWRSGDNISFIRMNYDTPNSRHPVPRPDIPRCREGMISHFQGWKREYYHYTTRPPSLNAHMMLTSRDGFIPLTLNNNAHIIPTIGESLSIIYGTTASSGNVAHLPTHQQAIAKKNLDARTYTGFEKRGLYCLIFKPDLKTCLSFVPESHITYARKEFRSGPATVDKDTAAIKLATLLMVGSVEDALSGAIEATLQNWTGNSSAQVVVIQYSGIGEGDTGELSPVINRMVGVDISQFREISEYSHESNALFSSQAHTYLTVVLVRIDDASHTLFDKTLYNIGLDLVPSDIVMLSPPGFRVSPQFASYASHLLDSEKQSDNQETSAPLALLPPPFVVDTKDSPFDWENFNAAALQDVAGYRSHMHQHRHRCHAYQPSLLKISYSAATSFIQLGESMALVDTKKLEIAASGEDAEDSEMSEVTFLNTGSALYPVIFNKAATKHGHNFFRFPEELNGQYCFSASVFSALYGSGYDLHWAPHIAVISADHMALVQSSSCDCAYMVQNEVKPYKEFLKNFVRRARLLRKEGIAELFARNPFDGPYEGK